MGNAALTRRRSWCTSMGVSPGSQDPLTKLGDPFNRGTLAVAPTSRAAWDLYEGTYAANVERFAAAHPDDPDAPAMLARIRPWREGYLRWGRTTLGFALLLWRAGTRGPWWVVGERSCSRRSLERESSDRAVR